MRRGSCSSGYVRLELAFLAVEMVRMAERPIPSGGWSEWFPCSVDAGGIRQGSWFAPGS